ncbi:MAG: substrate-binding domain-containing protein [Thermoplasmataceae archaeon]
MRKTVVAAILVAIIMIGVGVGVELDRPATGLVFYSADAYVAETNALISRFHNATGIAVEPAKGGGSYTLAEEISQGVPASVFISVALSTYTEASLGHRYSGWAMAFASDQLVLAYDGHQNSTVNNIVSLFSKANSTSNTSQRDAAYRDAFLDLTSGSVKVGISNASSDPAGLRAYLSLEIAGSLYENNSSFFTERIMKNQAVRSDSNAAELVSPLLDGDIGFLYIYRSAAISKNLDYVELPAQLSFGNTSLSTFYSEFHYNTTAGEQSGAPIYLYASALANGTDPAASVEFVSYIPGNDSFLSAYGLRPLEKPILFNNTLPPASITALASEGRLVYGGPILS